MQIILAVQTIRAPTLVSTRAAEILQAAAQVIRACLSFSNAEDEAVQRVYSRFVDSNTQRREAECHAAAAELIGRMSAFRDVSGDVNK